MQAHSIDVPPRETKSAPPSEAPELTAEDRAIQKRVLQKFFKDSMTLHAHITALNILALCQATDRNKAGMEIRRALNLPTRVPSKSETKQTLLVDLDGLVARTNAINDLYSVVKL